MGKSNQCNYELKIRNYELRINGTQMTQMKQISADFLTLSAASQPDRSERRNDLSVSVDLTVSKIRANPLNPRHPRSIFVSIRVIRGQKRNNQIFTKMNRIINIRAMAAIVVILAASINVQAQLGGALNRAKEAVQSGTSGQSSTTQSTTAQPAVPAAGQQLTPAERAAVEKLLDESKRTAPRVKEISDYQRDNEHIRDWFGRTAGKPVGEHQTVESAKAFKAAIEARNNENLAMFCVLFEVPANYDCSKALDEFDFANQRGNFPRLKQSVRNAVGDNNASKPDGVVEEINKYRTVMSIAADLVPRGTVEHRPDGQMQITIDWSVAGTLSDMVQVRDGRTVFVDVHRSGLIAPLDNATFVAECIKLDIVQTLLKKETDDPKAQRDQYWLALSAIQSLVQAQRNSMAGQEKVAVPAAQMNDPALTARMLKMAQDAYPTWGIVRLIIVESAWRPETNALGQIIHRRINTKVIYPRGNGFVMTTLSFIEPYSGGKYGEARPFGVGTDTVAVDYKP